MLAKNNLFSSENVILAALLKYSIAVTLTLLLSQLLAISRYGFDVI